MIYVYAVISAALVPILDRFFPVLRESYSIWLVPVIFIGAFLAFLILHLGIAILIYLSVNMNKPCKAYGFYRFLAKITMPLVLSVLRTKVISTGDELIPNDRRFVLVCNHTHLFDPLIFLGKYPDAEMTFIGKQEIVEKMPLVAKFMWSLKGMFVDRESIRSGAKVIIDSVKLLKNDEVNICVFPEGTRTKDGSLGELKPGAAKMAIKANVPVTVCTVKGVTDILHRFPFRSTTVYLDVLKTIETQEYADKTAEEITAEIRVLMEENLKRKAEKN